MGTQWCSLSLPALFQVMYVKPPRLALSEDVSDPPGWAAPRLAVPQISSTGCFEGLQQPELKLGSFSSSPKSLIIGITVEIWGTVSLFQCGVWHGTFPCRSAWGQDEA